MKGLSRPCSALNAATASGDTSSPRAMTAGSPGVNHNSVKRMNITLNAMGIKSNVLRIAYLSIRGSSVCPLPAVRRQGQTGDVTGYCLAKLRLPR